MINLASVHFILDTLDIYFINKNVYFNLFYNYEVIGSNFIFKIATFKNVGGKSH